MNETQVRRWLEAGGYGLLRSTAGGYLVTKGSSPHEIVYPVMGPLELNQGTSLERLLADVPELLPELGDAPTD